jgi:hypothetical protein
VCLVLATITIGYAWRDRTHSKADTIISGLVALTFLFATAQAGDILLLNGKKVSIHTNPLEPFLEQNPRARPKSNVMSTGNWRGYVATWQVKDDRFMLTDIEIVEIDASKRDHNESLISYVKRRSVMSTVFPDRMEVFADWFTGHVIIPEGKLVNYVHMGYASTYEKYIILRVEKGIVTRRWTVDSAGFVRFRNTQFDEFKRTEEYRRALSEIDGTPGEKRGVWSEEQKEQFLCEFYSGRYTSLIFDAQQ